MGERGGSFVLVVLDGVSRSRFPFLPPLRFEVEDLPRLSVFRRISNFSAKVKDDVIPEFWCIFSEVFVGDCALVVWLGVTAPASGGNIIEEDS